MKRFVYRIQSVMPLIARCFVCQEEADTCCRDLDFGGRFICDECAPHVATAEQFLRRECGLDTPTDDLIEAHL